MAFDAKRDTRFIVVNAWFARASDHDPTNWVMRSVENEGNESAHDVWVWLYHTDKPKDRLPLDRGGLIGLGGTREAKSGAAPSVRREHYLVTWRQAPNMKRIRRKVVRVHRIPKDWHIETKSVEISPER